MFSYFVWVLQVDIVV